jgi:hypothetical protein
LAVAVVACFLRGARFEEIGSVAGGGLLGGSGCVEGYNCAVAETGAFAEGGRSLRELVYGRSSVNRDLQAARDMEREERKVRRRKTRYGGLRIVEL